MFQRRVEGGTLNFTRLWDDYRNGFGDQGDATTELWLGNEHVYQLASGYGSVQGYFAGKPYYAFPCQGVVIGFSLEDEEHHYTMRATSAIPVRCTISDLISMANQPFRTLDRQLSAGYKDCFNTHSAGWWYYNDDPNKCYDTFLNGPHRPKGVQNEDAIFMRRFRKQLKGSLMMFRPTNFRKRLYFCDNPCLNETKTSCAYVPAENRHRCVCPPPLCGPDCSGPCENGGTCVLDLCQCAAGFEGTLCNDTVEEVEETTSAEETTSLEETTSVEETISVEETTSVEVTTSVEEVEETKSAEAAETITLAEYEQEFTPDRGTLVGALFVFVAVAGLAVFFIVNTISKRRAEAAAAAAAEERRALIAKREANFCSMS